MDETCLAADTVAWEGSFNGGELTRVVACVGEDLAEIGWSAEVDVSQVETIPRFS